MRNALIQCCKRQKHNKPANNTPAGASVQLPGLHGDKAMVDGYNGTHADVQDSEYAQCRFCKLPFTCVEQLGTAANVLQVLLHELLAAVHFAKHQLHAQVEFSIISKHLQAVTRYCAT
jgi:hypothetical protein